MRLSVSVILKIFISNWWKNMILYKCLDSLSKLFFGRSLTVKCVFIYNQPYMVRQRICWFKSWWTFLLFILTMNRCNESYKTVEDPFYRICVSNIIGDVNLKVFNKIEGINELKTLTKNRAFFHLWWKENLVKYQKISKYYENYCPQTFFCFLCLY